ncbi:hypothetical protein CDAR_110891 [Caerostris darwini]|uniref:Uncharacterized protein n=1 Tax=Caerostris darwini TaxID=1538125 RepID=A0AAV4QS59_9ARAC|nr:hypothetical protein CDAR_110891 [Caerostris darwini]
MAHVQLTHKIIGKPDKKSEIFLSSEAVRQSGKATRSIGLPRRETLSHELKLKRSRRLVFKEKVNLNPFGGRRI